jgi:spore maturation protein CgeB
MERDHPADPLTAAPKLHRGADLASPAHPSTGRRLPMHITLAALRHDYGKPERGYSFEYYNLYLTLKDVFERVDLFDFRTLYVDKGKRAMNEELLSFIRRHKPDWAIFALFQDEFIPEVIDEIRQYTRTLSYFFDDSWRKAFARFWIPHFDHFTTTSTSALRVYRDLGWNHAIFSPPGFNHTVYVRKDLSKIYDVSFVGGFHGHRDWIIRRIRRAGINVSVWGNMWPNGRLAQAEMVDVFNQSKISLNLSNSLCLDVRYLLGSPRWAMSDLRRCKKTKEQLKGRHFELGGCGTCQLSYYVEDLEQCYDIGKEIMIYMDVDDLIEKIRYLLKHDEERAALAEAGYRRARRDHTYARRFRDIVEHIRRQDPPAGYV